MSSRVKDSVHSIELYSSFEPKDYRMVISTDKHSPLVEHCYKYNGDTREGIQNRLIDLNCLRAVVSRLAMLATAYITFVVVFFYLMEGYKSFLIPLFFIAVTGVAFLVFLLIVEDRDRSDERATIRQTYTTYHQCRSDPLFRMLDSNFMICVSSLNRTPLSALVCEETYEQWNRIDGDSELDKRARTEMSDCIIETVHNIFQYIRLTPLYDDASGDMQQAFKDRVREEYIAPLVERLTAIADETEAAALKIDQAKREAARRQEAEALQQKEAEEAEEASRQARRELADDQIRKFIDGRL